MHILSKYAYNTSVTCHFLIKKIIKFKFKKKKIMGVMGGCDLGEPPPSPPHAQKYKKKSLGFFFNF
jgi:hypothetical protein